MHFNVYSMSARVAMTMEITTETVRHDEDEQIPNPKMHAWPICPCVASSHSLSVIEVKSVQFRISILQEGNRHCKLKVTVQCHAALSDKVAKVAASVTV